MQAQLAAQQQKLAELDSRLAAKAQANQALIEKRRLIEARSAAARAEKEAARSKELAQAAVCPPELKVRTQAHTKQLGWYV